MCPVQLLAEAERQRGLVQDPSNLRGGLNNAQLELREAEEAAARHNRCDSVRLCERGQAAGPQEAQPDVLMTCAQLCALPSCHYVCCSTEA